MTILQYRIVMTFVEILFMNKSAKIDLYLCIHNQNIHMNFLAHFILSHNHPEISFGNFMTDMLKPKEQRAWPEFLQTGIELHHFIDDFTDHQDRKSTRLNSSH